MLVFKYKKKKQNIYNGFASDQNVSTLLDETRHVIALHISLKGVRRNL